MDYQELLHRRRSSHHFTNEALTEEEINRILDAGQYAPIGSSRYRDLHLTAVTSRKILDELAQAARIRRKNFKEMAEIINTVSNASEILDQKSSYDPFYHAPAVIFISHRKQDLEPHIEWCNVTTVALTMHMAAADMGLGSCFMWFALDSMRRYPQLDRTELLKLPEGFKPLLGLAVGHIDKPLEPRNIDMQRISRIIM